MVQIFLVTRISPHYEYASAVMMDLIFLDVKQRDAIFKVRIIRVISVRKSGRAQKLYISHAELESYVGSSVTSGET